MLWPSTCHSLSSRPPAPLQLWYFWRRRLFIWISFMDSYFEILLYVRPHPSSPILAWEGAPHRLWGPGSSRGWDQHAGWTPELGCCWVQLITSTESSLCLSGA